MRVLLINSRPGSLNAWGGDTTQFVETHKYLRALGVNAELAEGHLPVSLNEYDLVHIFNIQTAEPARMICESAKRSQKKVALSTIYWDFNYTHITQNLLYGRSKFWSGCAKLAPNFALKLHRLRTLRSQYKTESIQKKLIKSADVLLPNSIAEMEILISKFDFPQARAKSIIVPNGVSVNLGVESEETPTQLKGIPQPFALMAGSFHPIKGQDRFIVALNHHREIPVLCIGHSRSTPYGSYCQHLAEKRGNTFLLDPVPQKEMSAFYQRAKIHVLPSLRESPGLSSLEAAVHGANCVVGIHAPVQEYFGSDAFVCDPLDITALRTAILQAWSASQNKELGKRIIAEFNWKKAAQASLRGYEMALNA